MTFFHGATRAAARADAGGSAAPGRLDAPLFYFHLTPGDSFIGGGIWHPQAETLRRIRAYIVNNPASWKQATQSAAFRRQFALTGDSLSRPPKGFDPVHPLIEDLKRKDFIGVAQVPKKMITNPKLPQELKRDFRSATPLMEFLCDAVNVPF